MLHRIGRRPADEIEGPVQALLACHQRIRSFTALAQRLISTTSASSGEVTEAATQLERYFGIALPLHVADEEASIRPRLLAIDPSLERALAAMTEEHETIELGLGRLVPLWACLVRTPDALERERSALEGDTSRLRDVFGDHLASEESRIFPAIDRLPPDERAAILQEMQARRAPPR